MARALVALALLTPAIAQGAPDREAAEAFVRQLDHLFNAGERGQYLARFAKRHHPGLHMQLARLLNGLGHFKGLRAKTTSVDWFQRRGVGVLAVETKYTQGDASFTMPFLIGVQKQGKGLIGRFATRFAKKDLPLIRGKLNRFHCPACNYELRYNQDWLAVPVMPTTSGCMEALLLLSMRHDLHVETAVHIGSMPQSAARAMDACIESERAKGRFKDEKPATYKEWRPRAFAKQKNLPEGMSTVRAVRHCKMGICSELNLIAMGRLRYLLVVRGDHDSIKQNRKAIDAVLGSFRLIQPGLRADRMAKVANYAHTGKGTLSPTNRYENKKYKLAFQGPKDWLGTVHAGPWLFQLRFECPLSDAKLHVRVLPRLGLDWNTCGVDNQIAKALTTRGRQIVAGTDSAWQRGADGLHHREFHTRAGAGKPSHVVRYSMRKDMLVIVDGTYSVPAAKAAIVDVLGKLEVLK